MRTSQQYLDSLAKMKPNLWLDGKKIGRDHKAVVDATYVLRQTFDLASHPDYQKWLTVTSHLSGKTINRFTHMHQNVEDLLMKQEMTRKLCNLTGGCIQRCMGCDMSNAMSISSKNADLKYGTSYHENFLKYINWFQENDIVASGAQTDAKGDRMARPAQQWDPDQYLHVVERRPDGVVVRGAKLHNTMCPYANEILVVPTRRMMDDEKDWAISFAIPADTEGVHLIIRPACVYPRHGGTVDAPIQRIADLESMTVFDNVFVPNERIFLNGETDIAGEMALLFALYHRHSYTGCKPGLADIMLGISALLAEIQGIDKQSHVKSKFVDIISVGELVYAGGIASAIKSTRAPSGNQMPNVIYANVARRHAGHNVYHEYNLVCDISGGLPATLPLTEQYNSPEIGKFVRKYVTRKKGVSEEDCYRIFHLASDLLSSEYATVTQIAGVHGGGSPIMEDIAITSTYDLKPYKNLARYLAGVKPVA